VASIRLAFGLVALAVAVAGRRARRVRVRRAQLPGAGVDRVVAGVSGMVAWVSRVVAGVEGGHGMVAWVHGVVVGVAHLRRAARRGVGLVRIGLGLGLLGLGLGNLT